LILAATLPLTFFSIGYTILKSIKALKDIVGDVPSTLSLSFFIGASILITSSTLIGTLLGSGLKFLFYAFYILGIILSIFHLTQYTRHLTIKKLRVRTSSKNIPFFLILALFSLLFYLYYPLSNPMPRNDAVEAYLPMARYFCEYDGIPTETSVYFLAGKAMTIPPGISLLQAFAFTISQSFSPMNLAFLEIAFLLCFSTLAYAFSIRCNLSKVEASLAAILMLNLPYWSYYFLVDLHYIDLESAFMVSASIYLLLVLLKDMKTKRLTSALPVLGVVLFATVTSKLQSLIVLVFIFALILKLSSVWRKHRDFWSAILFLGYVLAVPMLTSEMYVYTTIFGKEPAILFFTAISLIPLIIFLRMEFREEDRATFRTWLPLLIVSLFSLYWYVRILYIGSSVLSPIKTGDGAWAGEILQKTMKWGGLEFLYTRHLGSAFNILHSIYSFTFLVPLVVGVKYFQSLKGFFPKGIKLWFLIGITVFLGVLEKSWRYVLFFMLPITILVSRGVFKIAEKHFRLNTRSSLTFISLIFFLTFPPIDRYLVGLYYQQILNWGATLILSILGWMTLLFINSLNTPLKMWKLKFPKVRIRNKRRSMTIFVLSVILLVSGSITIQHYSREYPISKAKAELYNQVSVDARTDRVLVSVGTLGLYYFTGVNTLHIVQPDELAILRPLFEAPDIDQGLNFLIHELSVGSVVFRAEEGGLYREWYVYLLDELPELRILYNPQLFETVLYTPKYFYFLNLVAESWRPYGVLDVVVRGSDLAEEASLFLPYDYGEQQTFVTYSHEGVKLVVFLYFPNDLIQKTKTAVTYNVTVNLTITDFYKDRNATTPKILSSQFSSNLSKVVQLETELIQGNNYTEHTDFKIEEIEIQVHAESFEAYFHLSPKNSSISSPGTRLIYFPRASGRWDHLGSNLIETNASLRILD